MRYRARSFVPRRLGRSGCFVSGQGKGTEHTQKKCSVQIFTDYHSYPCSRLAAEGSDKCKMHLAAIRRREADVVRRRNEAEAQRQADEMDIRARERDAALIASAPILAADLETATRLLGELLMLRGVHGGSILSPIEREVFDFLAKHRKAGS